MCACECPRTTGGCGVSRVCLWLLDPVLSAGAHERVGLGWGVGPRVGQVLSTPSSASINTGVLVSNHGSSGSGKSRSPSWPRPEALSGHRSTVCPGESRAHEAVRTGLAGRASGVHRGALWHLQQGQLCLPAQVRDRAPSPLSSVTRSGAGRLSVARQCPPYGQECGEGAELPWESGKGPPPPAASGPRPLPTEGCQPPACTVSPTVASQPESPCHASPSKAPLSPEAGVSTGYQPCGLPGSHLPSPLSDLGRVIPGQVGPGLGLEWGLVWPVSPPKQQA